MDDTGLPARIAAVREFSRCYTRRIGVLHEGLLGSTLSLTEARIVYELAQAETTAARLAAELDLDTGYLSRILRGLQSRGVVGRRPSANDRRESVLSLTEAGREVFCSLDAQSREEVGVMLSRLGAAEQRRLVTALEQATVLLDGAERGAVPTILRPHGVGDMGWIVHRQAVLYAQEFGWPIEFEALLAEIVAAFIRSFAPGRERCWIAERGGEIIGSVFLVRASAEVAKLRMLYVEPSARGLGIGQRLVSECIHSARELGYRRLTLWTNSVLVSARRIYQAAGFRLTAEQPHHSFGHDLVGQTWDLDL